MDWIHWPIMPCVNGTSCWWWFNMLNVSSDIFVSIAAPWLSSVVDHGGRPSVAISNWIFQHHKVSHFNIRVIHLQNNQKVWVMLHDNTSGMSCKSEVMFHEWLLKPIIWSVMAHSLFLSGTNGSGQIPLTSVTWMHFITDLSLFSNTHSHSVPLQSNSSIYTVDMQSSRAYLHHFKKPKNLTGMLYGELHYANVIFWCICSITWLSYSIAK